METYKVKICFDIDEENLLKAVDKLAKILNSIEDKTGNIYEEQMEQKYH